MSQKNQKRDSFKKKVASKLDDMIQESDESAVAVEEPVLNRSAVEWVDETKTRMKIENNIYDIAVDYREAVNIEKIAERYNTILNKYDFIVGDWGYDQLRLRGFYHEDNRRAPFEKKISFLEDYLYEFCNFGCAYFVLEKERSEKPKKSKAKRQRNRGEQQHAQKPQQQSKKEFTMKKQEHPRSGQPKRQGKNRTPKNTEQPNTQFKIRKVDE